MEDCHALGPVGLIPTCGCNCDQESQNQTEELSEEMNEELSHLDRASPGLLLQVGLLCIICTIIYTLHIACLSDYTAVSRQFVN